MIASLWELASEHAVTFGLGVVVGFIAADRYRLVKRNGDEAPR